MTTSLSRRTLVRGAAWSAPVVAASATIPAFAASNDLCQLSGSLTATNDFYYGNAKLDSATGRWVYSNTNADGDQVEPYMRWSLSNLNVIVNGLADGETITSTQLIQYVQTLTSNDDLTQDPAGFYPYGDAQSETGGTTNAGWNFYGGSSATPVTLTSQGTTVSADMWSVEYMNRAGSGTLSATSDGCFSHVGSVLSQPLVVSQGANVLPLQFDAANHHFIPNWGVRALVRTSAGRQLEIVAFMWNNGALVKNGSTVL